MCVIGSEIQIFNFGYLKSGRIVFTRERM